MEKNIVTQEKENCNKINICDEVIQSIAAHAVKDTEGVLLSSSLADGIVEKLVRKNNYKNVRVEITDESVSLDVHISIVYGLKIHDICALLQEKIKRDIETITDMNVESVNIYVDAISIEKSSPAEEKKEEKMEETTEE